MEHDFVTLHPPYGTAAPMWERLSRFGEIKEDEICFGVAEMKFKTAPEIVSALERQAREGGFGYYHPGESLLNEVCSWQSRRHGWRIEKDWTIQSYGIVQAIGVCVRALTKPGDGILLHFPSYPPFYRTILGNGRRLVRTDLVRENNRYVMDFDDIERKLSDPSVTLMILCSPHNPTGRVWERSELERLLSLCLKYNVRVVSDEIHNDLVYSGHTHTVFASLPGAEKITVTMTAPSKTFNIAGLTESNVIIPDASLRELISNGMARDAGGYINIMGMVGCEAAYRDAESWLDDCLKVLEGNCRYFKEFVDERLPAFSCFMPEGTYLMWLDGTNTHLTPEGLEDLMWNGARFFTQHGIDFGEGFGLFHRVNLACPRQYVESALERLERAARERGII